MKKIKIIRAINIQEQVDIWTKENKPNIISTSISSISGTSQCVISIVYEETVKVDDSKVIRTGPTIKNN